MSLVFDGLGGEGGGLTLGPAQNEFDVSGAAVAANRARANAIQARDAYTAAPANAGWLAEYDADPNIAIILTFIASGEVTTEYQARRGGAWAVVTPVAEGRRGPPPTDGQVTAAVQAGVKAYARIGGPLLAGTDADPSFLLESEVTRSFLLGLIGLSAAEIEAAFDDARVEGSDTGRVIVIDRRGGGTVRLPVPDTSGGGEGGGDGVVRFGVYDAATQSIDLTISTGGTVSIPLGLLIAAIDAGQPPPVPPGTGSDAYYILQRTADGQSRWFLFDPTNGGGDMPVQHATLYFGTSADRDPTAAELTVQGVEGAGTINAYAGERHVLVARLASESDLIRIMRSDDDSGTNQIGAFSKHGGTVNKGGAAYNVWVSNQALSQAANVTWSAS